MTFIQIDPNPGRVAIVDATGSHILTLAISTTNENDLIVVDIESNAARVTGVSSPSLGSFTARANISDGNENIARYYAVASSPLSSEVITVVTNTGVNFVSIIAYAISNANISSPFDAAVVTGLTSGAGGVDPLSITTSHPQAMIIGTYREHSTANTTGDAGAGYTQIGANPAGYMLTEYRVVGPGTYSVNQTGAASGDANGGIIDAIVASYVTALWGSTEGTDSFDGAGSTWESPVIQIFGGLIEAQKQANNGNPAPHGMIPWRWAP
jgi:hypothetical protein